VNLKFVSTNTVEITTKFDLEYVGQNTGIMTVRYWRASKRDERTGKKLKRKILERKNTGGFKNQPANQYTETNVMHFLFNFIKN
jgi:hypothetical protein